MHTREISQPESIELSSRAESHFFEKKSRSVSGKAIQKIVVAFANSDGGELLIGIADKNDEEDVEKRWQGFSEIESLNGHLQAIFDVQPNPDIRYEFLKHEKKPGYVLRVTIEKSSEVHKTSENKVYTRHGAQSLPLNDPHRITQLSFAKGSTTYEDMLISDIPPEQIVESDALKSFLSDYSPKTDPLDFVLNQNLIDGKSWVPKVASTLLFHPAPSAVVPKKCAVKITRYETKEDDPEREHLAEQRTIEGSSYILIENTVKGVKDIMSAVQVWTTDGLKQLDYPPEALWEIIVNAIIHRDYSISDDIQILIFDNRIEVLSPGRLPGYVTTENILEARYSRNPKLVRTLNRYKDAPNKDLGEGLNTTFQKMKEWGLKSPIIFEDGNYVKVILPHVPLAAPTEAILDFLKTHASITNKQARELTGIKSENLVKVEFYKLRDAGLIERVPGLSGPKSAWRLVGA
jgi:ATP-dependent DNA helicase RecG